MRAVVSVVRLGRPVSAYPPGRRRRAGPTRTRPPPLLPAFPLPPDGFVLRETATGWRDEQHSAYCGLGRRPARSSRIRCWTSPLGPNGTGWAVGGWSGEQDAAGSGSSATQLHRARGPHARADRGRVPLRRRRAAAPRRSSGRRAAAVRARRASPSPATPRARPRARTSRCRTSARTGRWPRRWRRWPRCARSRTAPGCCSTPAAAWPPGSTRRPRAARRRATRRCSPRTRCPCIRPCRRPTPPRARPPFRTSFASVPARRSAAARRRPASTPSAYRGAPPGPGRPHALRVRLDRARGRACA